MLKIKHESKIKHEISKHLFEFEFLIKKKNQSLKITKLIEKNSVDLMI